MKNIRLKGWKLLKLDVLREYFNNVRKLSLFGKLNSWEFTILVLTAIFPLILYIDYPIHFYLFFISAFISSFLSIRDKRYSGEIKKVYGFSWLFGGGILIQVLVLTVFVINQDFPYGVANLKSYFTVLLIALTVIIYIFFIVGFLFYIVNYLFFMIIKVVFPNQLTEVENNKWISLRKISSYMTVDTQIAYLLITILHLLIYFFIVFYILVFLLMLDNTKNDVVYLAKLVDWAMTNNVASFGNTLGITSIVITLISITYPAQMKLYFKAVETKEKTIES